MYFIRAPCTGPPFQLREKKRGSPTYVCKTFMFSEKSLGGITAERRKRETLVRLKHLECNCLLRALWKVNMLSGKVISEKGSKGPTVKVSRAKEGGNVNV